jgi:hypothetical protein
VSVAVMQFAGSNLDQQTYQPLSSPINVDIVDHRVQSGVDVICLVGWENDVSSVATFLEGLEYGWHIIGRVGSARMHSTTGSLTAVRERDTLC